MTHNLLKVALPDMIFEKFQTEFISIFGSKKEAKTMVSTSVVRGETSKADPLVKPANQLCREKKKRRLRQKLSNRVAKEKKIKI